MQNMKIIVISDTHGYNAYFDVILKHEGMPDMVVHCGDLEGGEYYFSQRVECPVVMVRGNNDYSPALKNEEVVTAGTHKILVTHGHMQHLYLGTGGLEGRAQAYGTDVVLYGHTHVPRIYHNEETGVWFINPGSLSYPRQEGRKPSYCVIEMSGNNDIEAVIKYL